MKRQMCASSCDTLQKKNKEDVVIDEHELEILKDLESVQSQLLSLDDECVKEQFQIQRKFSARMRPLMLKRQDIISKIPNFWGRVLSNIPMDDDHIFCQEDMEILPELEVLDLDDNIDDNGSYKLTMKFSDKVKNYFSPTVLEKLVVFEDKEGGEPTVTCTNIEWVPGQNIVEKVRERRLKNQETDDGEMEFSLLEWFTDDSVVDSIQLGELIRRHVWNNPLHFLCDNMKENSDDEDDEVDSKEEEEEEDEDDEEEA